MRHFAPVLLALALILAGCDDTTAPGEEAPPTPAAKQHTFSNDQLTTRDFSIGGTLAKRESGGTLRLDVRTRSGGETVAAQEITFTNQKIAYRPRDGGRRTHVLSPEAAHLLAQSRAAHTKVPGPLRRLEERLGPDARPPERAAALREAGFSVEAIDGSRYRVHGTAEASGVRAVSTFDLGDGSIGATSVRRGPHTLARVSADERGKAPRVEALPPDVRAAQLRADRYPPTLAPNAAPPPVALAQNGRQHVAFVHGLFGDENSWDDTRALFQDELDVTTSNKPYDSATPIGETAATYSADLPDGSIYVAHSMGGLVAREVYRQFGDQKIDALITLGTPHTGAPMSDNLNHLGSLADGWLEDLAAGPSYQLGGAFGETIYDVTSGGLSFGDLLDLLKTLITDAFASTQDLRPGSAFFGQLGNARPPVTYAIRSSEDVNAPARLADAALNDAVETGTGNALYEDATALYSTLYANAQANADDYLEDYQNTAWWRFVSRGYYWNRYAYWSGVAAGYAQGVELLTAELNRQWEEDLVGVAPGGPGPDGRGLSDGVVPYASQAPAFIPPEFRLSAQGVNHLEQVNNAETRDRLRFALRQLGVQER